MIVDALDKLYKDRVIELQTVFRYPPFCSLLPWKDAQKRQKPSPRPYSMFMAVSGFKHTILTPSPGIYPQIPECWEWQAPNRPLHDIVRADAEKVRRAQRASGISPDFFGVAELQK